VTERSMTAAVETANSRIDFGRYRGSTWAEVPEEYLMFLCSRGCNTTEDRERLARMELFRRMAVAGEVHVEERDDELIPAIRYR